MNSYHREKNVPETPSGLFEDKPKHKLVPVLTISLPSPILSWQYETNLKYYLDQISLLNIDTKAIHMITTDIRPNMSEEEIITVNDQMSKVNKQRVANYTCELRITDDLASKFQYLEIEEIDNSKFG